MWMRRMCTIIATWLSTNETIEDGVLRQKGLDEECDYNHGYWLSTNERVEDVILRQKSLEEKCEYNHGYLAEYKWIQSELPS